MWATEFSCRSQIIYVILNWEAGCQLELCAVPSPVIVCLECSLSTVSAILCCQVWWWFLLGMSSVQLLEWLPSESTPSSNTAVRACRPPSSFFLLLLFSGHFWATWSPCVVICLPLFVTGLCCLTCWPNRNGQTPALLVKGWGSLPPLLFVQLLLNVVLAVELELSSKVSPVCGWAWRAVCAYGFWSDCTWCSVMVLVCFGSDWLQQWSAQVCKGAAFQGSWCCSREGGVTDFWNMLLFCFTTIKKKKAAGWEVRRLLRASIFLWLVVQTSFVPRKEF